MEDFGNIFFFVLIAVIGIISSVFGKKKPSRQVRETNKKRSLSQELEELFDPSPEQEPTIPYDQAEEPQEEEGYYEQEPAVQASARNEREAQYHSAYEGALEKGDYTFSSDSEGTSGLDQASIAEARMQRYLREMHSGDKMQVLETIGIQDDTSRGARLARDFNLPEAIVYSEILNRKEF